MTKTAGALLSSGALIGLTVATAGAQINSPTPALMAQPSFHVWSVPGVIRDIPIATVFACTNTTDASVRVGVELFQDGGGPAINDPSASSQELTPGDTEHFTTAPVVAFTGETDVNDNVVGIPEGSARILATTKKGIICSAYLIDYVNDPPTFMAGLIVVNKTKQKGD